MVFGIVGNTEKKELSDILNEFVIYLLKNGIQFILHDDLKNKVNSNVVKSSVKLGSMEQLLDQSDILLSFGGDGTILSVARHVANSEVPIVGINLGKLGFLAEIGKDEIYDFMKDLLSGNYIIEERMMLEAQTSEYSDVKLIGLNDIVIEKSQTSRLLNIRASVNDEHLITTMSDGIIISTPTGSTAYSLASNGPIVVPSSKVIIINSICPHTLTVRPIIVPDDFVFKAMVDSQSAEAMVTADGQVEIKLKTPFEISIKKADYPIKLIKRKDVSYYEILRSKLMWGKDLRII
jgi:NAD+ kinase